MRRWGYYWLTNRTLSFSLSNSLSGSFLSYLVLTLWEVAVVAGGCWRIGGSYAAVGWVREQLGSMCWDLLQLSNAEQWHLQYCTEKPPDGWGAELQHLQHATGVAPRRFCLHLTHKLNLVTCTHTHTHFVLAQQHAMTVAFYQYHTSTAQRGCAAQRGCDWQLSIVYSVIPWPLAYCSLVFLSEVWLSDGHNRPTISPAERTVL